ncbi:sensor histidine kinase [Bauldia sp.]|uniref:sensor histidine kinase n=1 Tax=Bauldia sp. TaxID=2575872 RepID=UPI003BA8CDF5
MTVRHLYEEDDRITRHDESGGLGRWPLHFSSQVTVAAAVAAALLSITLGLAAISTHPTSIVFLALAVSAILAQGAVLLLTFRYGSAAQTAREHRSETARLKSELLVAETSERKWRRLAKEAHRTKSRFLATMSHELRTPLNAIIGFSEIMSAKELHPVDETKHREYAASIHSSGQHLLNLIDDILDLSRIEAGHEDLNEEPIHLADVADACRRMIEPKSLEKSITVSERYQSDLPRLWADDRAIRQIVLNLLTNAVKYTPTGGSITIEVGTVAGGQFVCVRDTGPGIAENEIPIALSAFGRGIAATRGAEQGVGLGLPIVQALVQLHEGTFTLRSPPGEGTYATVTFPASRVMREQSEPTSKSRWREAS